MYHSAKGSPQYFSHAIQNEFIQIMSNHLFKEIVTGAQSAKYFAIILDCTPDISHKEQMSVVIRFVDTKVNKPVVCESFIGFLNVETKTGEGLTDAILQYLEETGLNYNNIRGQAYDNGSNMKGDISGVQRRILNINPRAFFVACANHTCNLTLNDGAKSSTDTITFFGTIQKLYTFASGSTNRWDILRKHVKLLSLKPLSTTRWESRLDSLKSIRYQISQIRDALDEIGDSENFDSTCRFEAKNLSAQIENFKFLVLLSGWYEILQHLNILSKMFQQPSIDGSSTINLIQETDAFLTEFQENGFQQALQVARELGRTLELSENEMKFDEKRTRKRKKHFDESDENDTPIISQSGKFKRDCFDKFVQHVHDSMLRRFEAMKSNLSDFQILYDTKLRQTMADSELLKNCKDIHLNLSDNAKNSDLDGTLLYEEFLLLKSSFPSKYCETPFNILSFIMEQNLVDIFPNLWILLRIFLTIPVSVATSERSFSKLRLIKKYLRSTMSQERLTGLAMLSIEHELAANLNFDVVVDDFAAKKSRKVIL